MKTNKIIVSVKKKRDFLNIKLLKKLYALCLLFILGNTVLANDLAINNVSLTGRNVEFSYTLVQFDISWENSWRINDGPSNWDAAWVLVKYRKKSETTWHHATLNWTNGSGSGDGHIEPANTNIVSSNDNGSGGAYGVFIHRDTNMDQGSVNYTGVQLRWNYGIDGLTDSDSVEVCVSGIEMVYIPTTKFYIGSGGSEVDAFYKYPTTTNPFQITNEDAITVGTTADNLYYPSTANGGDQTGPIPAAFPKGYKGFYCMKYEITQEQYVTFLNKLTRDQQNERTFTSIGSGTTLVSNRYVMSNKSTLEYRNGIRCDGTIHVSDPINFYCDLDGDGIPNETNDGQNIACNFLDWKDLAAYLDWAGLRPMTELEYEKASRGNGLPLANEYAWGIASIAVANGISNAGLNNETASNAGANCIYASGVSGPMRSGCLGQGVNTRSGVGASYYGIMEFSGNLQERTVTVGNATGRTFTGIHGNGILNASGDANVTHWPGTNAIGAGFRGGGWNSNVSYLRVSDRADAAFAIHTRSHKFGGRGCRVAP